MKSKKAELQAWLDKRSVPHTKKATKEQLLVKIKDQQAKEKRLAESPTLKCRGLKHHDCEIRENGVSKFISIVPGKKYDLTPDEIRRFTDPALSLPIVEVFD